ncbi:MAG: hypothetical protein ACOX7W_09630, partial [Christensenellales bacterium]
SMQRTPFVAFVFFRSIVPRSFSAFHLLVLPMYCTSTHMRKLKKDSFDETQGIKMLSGAADNPFP